MRLRQFLSPFLSLTLSTGTLAAAPALAFGVEASSGTPDAYVLDVFSVPTVDEVTGEDLDDADLAPIDSMPADENTEQEASIGEDAPVREPDSIEPDALHPIEPAEIEDPGIEPDTPEQQQHDGADTPTTTPTTGAIAPASFQGDFIALEEPEYDILSAPLSTETFNVAAVTWTGTAPQTIEIRTESSGVWGDWYALEVEASENGGVSGTEPYIAAGSSGIQLRAMFTTEPATFELVLLTGAGTRGSVEESDAEVADNAPPADTAAAVNVNATSTLLDSLVLPAVHDGSPSLPTIGSSTAPLQPASIKPKNVKSPDIVSRHGWGAPERATWRPTTAELKGAVVHHTAGNNDYSPAESPAITRSIWNYHTNTRGWGDVGYNFLIDKYGVIYEGREGSQASAPGKMPIGAHATPANTGTVGISVMGTYTTRNPEPVVLERISDIIAWQFGTAGIDPTGTWQFTPYTGSLPQTMNRVIGHMDVANTACPGLIQNYLPSIQKAAKEKILGNSSSSSGTAVAGKYGDITPGLDYATNRRTAIYNQANLNGNVLASLSFGAVITTTSRSYKLGSTTWWEVRYGTVRGWVPQAELTLITRHSNSGRVNADYQYATNKRTALLSTIGSRESVMTLSAHTNVMTTTMRFGSYWKVRVNNTIGWINRDDLVPNTSMLPHYLDIASGYPYVTTSSVMLYGSPNPTAKVLNNLAADSLVHTSGRAYLTDEASWWEVSFDGGLGWIKRNELTFASGHRLSGHINHDYQYATKTSTPLLHSPYGEARVVNLAQGSLVMTQSDRFGDYWSVRVGETQGWVSRNHLQPAMSMYPQYGIVNQGYPYATILDISLLDGPIPTTARINALDSGTIVHTTGRTYKTDEAIWWQVEFGNQIGWINRSQLTFPGRRQG